MHKLLRKSRERRGIEESELLAKKSLISFIFSFQSADQIAWSQTMIEYDGLPGLLQTYTTVNRSWVGAADIRCAGGACYYELAVWTS